MPWTLIITLGLLAIGITVLMRPDIFLTVLRGGGEKTERKIYRPKSEAQFQADLNNTGRSPETKDESNG